MRGEHAQDLLSILRGRQQGLQSRAALQRGRRRPLVFQNGGWAGQGKGLQAMNSSSESQRKVHFPLKQCGEEVGGQQGSLSGQGGAWLLSSVAGEPPQASILCLASPPGSGPD